MAPAEASTQYELIIEPGRVERNYWRDIWRFRELLYFLAQRDILVRYKQTAIGVVWALLKPVMTVAIFVAFRSMAKIKHTDLPDVLVVYAGLLPWQLFSTGLSESALSLIQNANLVSKVYFPRLLVPIGSVVTALVDYGIMLVLLAVLMGWYHFPPGPQMLLLIPLTALTFLFAVGTGVLVAALNVEYRDFRYIVPFIVQFGLFASPIAIETSKVPAQYRFFLFLNPMTGIIDGFRWAILRSLTVFDPVSIYISAAVTSLFVWAGIRYFRRTERRFADVI